MVVENEEGRNVICRLKSPKNEGTMVKLYVALEMITCHLLRIAGSTIYISLMTITIICASIGISIGSLDDNSYGDVILIGTSSNTIYKTATIEPNQDEVEVNYMTGRSGSEMKPAISSPSVQGSNGNLDGTSRNDVKSKNNLNNKNIFVLIVFLVVLFVLINKYG